MTSSGRRPPNARDYITVVPPTTPGPVRQGYRLPSPEIQHERPAGGVDHVLRLGVVAVDLPIILPVAARLPTKSASLTPLDHAVELHLVMPRPGATIGEPLCVRIPPVASSVACCAA